MSADHILDILDAREAARYLKLNEQTIRRLARANKIPAFKVGGSWRFKKDLLDRWVEHQHASGRRRYVLAVDDEPIVLDFIRPLLEAEGFEVATASDGPSALELMRRHLPELVMLDLKMPGMDGPALLREIRARWRRLPVIILTGYMDSELMTRALPFAPVTVLAKPSDPEQVVAAVRAALGMGRHTRGTAGPSSQEP